MSNLNIIQTLESALAGSYALAVKTQNYHWNVTGQNFKGLHQLFEDQYNELIAIIDDIAERIRALGEKVNGNFDFYNENSKFKAADPNKSSGEMVQDLINDNQSFIEDLKDYTAIAQKNGDEATADIFIQRTQIHQKNLWMLKSLINA